MLLTLEGLITGMTYNGMLVSPGNPYNASYAEWLAVTGSYILFAIFFLHVLHITVCKI